MRKEGMFMAPPEPLSDIINISDFSSTISAISATDAPTRSTFLTFLTNEQLPLYSKIIGSSSATLSKKSACYASSVNISTVKGRQPSWLEIGTNTLPSYR